jgi:hypothetical protein
VVKLVLELTLLPQSETQELDIGVMDSTGQTGLLQAAADWTHKVRTEATRWGSADRELSMAISDSVQSLAVKHAVDGLKEFLAFQSC